MTVFDRESTLDNLYWKMVNELNSFRASLLELTPAEIINDFKAYELIYKEDIVQCFEGDEMYLSDDELVFLFELEAPLDWLYQSWSDSDVSHMELLREFIKGTVQMTLNGLRL